MTTIFADGLEIETERKAPNELWVVNCGPPELEGLLDLDYLNVHSYSSFHPADGRFYFASREEALNKTICRLFKLKTKDNL
jgi:hypothetical protein